MLKILSEEFARNGLRRLDRQHKRQDEIEDISLRTAMDLLTGTKASVDSIAQRCGYAGASSLLHLFAKHLGTTPAEWRKGGGKR